MSDERDDLDRALAAGLGGLAGDGDDPDAVLATMRPRLRRAQTRHRVAIASVAILSVLGIAGLGAAMTGSNHQRGVDVSAAPTSTSAEPSATSTTRPTTTTRPANRSTATTVPDVPTTLGNRGPGSGVTPGGSNGSSGGHSGGSGSSTPVPPSPTTVQPAKSYTYTALGGTVTVRFANGALTLLSYQANSGYSPEVATRKPDDIEVRFSKGSGQDSRIRVQVENGQVTEEHR